MPTYSIIVPVYQAEDYIAECIESVLNQEGDVSWELILVDNGTLDNSAAICESYAEKDSRIRVIHQENRGPGGGRNAGLKIAAGEYIFFADSDDFCEPNLLATLETMRGSQPDMMVFSNYIFGGTWERDPKERKHLLLVPNGESGIEWMQRGEAAVILPPATPWVYSYRREFLLENQLFYREDLIGPEDLEFNLRVIPYAQSVVGMDVPLYNWRYRAESTSQKLTETTYTRLVGWLTCFAEMYRRNPTGMMALVFAEYAALVGHFSPSESKEATEIIRNNLDIYEKIPPSSQRILVPLTRIFGIHKGGKIYILLKNFKFRSSFSFIRNFRWPKTRK